MTDCGGLLNRRGPGRKCCCHTGLFTRDIRLFSSHGWFLSRIIELVYFHTEHRGESRSFHTSFLFVPNYRICELVYFHTEHRGRSRGFVTNYRIVEFFFTRRVTESLGIYVTNYRIIESLFTRKITEVFFVTRHVLGHEFARLVLGPTDQREVIVEFLSSRGMSRMVAEVMRVEL